MKVEFFVDSGANIQSCKSSGELDTYKDLGYTDSEWSELSWEEKHNLASEWANNYIEIYFKEYKE